MFLVAIRQSLSCQNVSTENSLNFPFVKVSQYTVVADGPLKLLLWLVLPLPGPMLLIVPSLMG